MVIFIEENTNQPKDIKKISIGIEKVNDKFFREDLDIEQKKMFINCILRKIRNELPDVGVTQITTCQHEMKTFRQLKFPSDQSK